MFLEQTNPRATNSNPQLSPSPRSIAAEDRNILIDLRSLLLHDALADPHQISNLLQLEMAVAVIRRYLSRPLLSLPTQMELAIEPGLQQSHFVQIERVVHRHLIALDRRLEDPLVHPVLLQHAAQTVHVLAVVQRLHSLRVQKPDRRQERVSQIAQLRLGLTPSLPKTYIVVHRVEAVQHQIDRQRVRLRLQNVAHDLRGESAHALRPVVEVFQVQLLHADLHHLDRALFQQTLHQLRALRSNATRRGTWSMWFSVWSSR